MESQLMESLLLAGLFLLLGVSLLAVLIDVLSD